MSPLSQTVVAGPGISTVMPTVLGYTETEICRLTTCTVHQGSRVEAVQHLAQSVVCGDHPAAGVAFLHLAVRWGQV